MPRPRRSSAPARRRKGATLYVTLEPCSHQGKTPPCVDAIIRAGIARVVSALEDPNPEVAGQGYAKLRERGIAVDDRAWAPRRRARQHAGHIRRMRDGRPQVLLKLAVSADGKAGLPGRKPAGITGEAARARVHLMRAEADAILVGIGTVLSDDPHLTCRLPGMIERSPVRVVLDARLARAARDLARRHRARDADLGVHDAERVADRRGHSASRRASRCSASTARTAGSISQRCSRRWPGAASPG